MTPMLDLIRENRELLERRSQEVFLARAGSKPKAEELNHGLPILIHQIAEALGSATGTVPEQAVTDTATEYGGRLFGLGFTIAELVHAYGAVCQAVMELGGQRGASFSPQDYELLNRVLDMAIAAAVSEHQRRRTAEVVRRDTTHLGLLAHELWNAVSAATAAFQIIQEGSVGVSGHTADILHRNLTRIGDLIDRTVAEVRLETSAAAVSERVRLLDVFDQISPLLAMEAAKRHQKLEIDVDRGIEVDADRQLLTSAVSNVTQNAIRYTRAKGHVSVRAHRTDGRVTIDVVDECGGLPRNLADQLTKPFNYGTSEDGGMGLGLSIAARAMASLHGDLRVHDRPGEGCIFSLDLPAAATSDREAAPMQAFIGDVDPRAKEYREFRHVLYTGPHMQLVVMALQPDEEIGEELHAHVDQFFLVEEGGGEITVDGKTTAVRQGIAIIVPAGARHNVKNTGRAPMKLLTLYAPPEHPDGTVHHTKAEAEAARELSSATPSPPPPARASRAASPSSESAR